MEQIEQSEQIAATVGLADVVGSHCDLNAHSVVFTITSHTTSPSLSGGRPEILEQRQRLLRAAMAGREPASAEGARS
ncbi:hypothetical protein [Desertimonas flava]|uniref:hypothetical protein n=1 Tax=Desertimonas flava TaxID=2064846 RepID=UPI000E356771|nr:hypothetical protein [Desertimonas flava]